MLYNKVWFAQGTKIFSLQGQSRLDNNLKNIKNISFYDDT